MDAASPTFWAQLVARLRARPNLTLALAAVFGLLVLRLPLGTLSEPTVYLKDLFQDYLMARAIAAGIDPYQLMPVLLARVLGAIRGPGGVMPVHPSPHPATVAIVLLPLASLGFPVVATIWLACELAILVALVALLGAAFRARLGPAQTLAIATALIAWTPVTADLANGQLVLPVAALVVASLVAAQRGHTAVAGCWLGLSLLVKPVAAPVAIVFLVRRWRRALATLCGTVALGAAPVLLVIGPPVALRYLTRVVPYVSLLYRTDIRNQSAWTMGQRLFVGMYPPRVAGATATGVASAPLLPFPGLADPTGGVAVVLLIALTLLAVARSTSLTRAFALTTCAAVLVAPVSWTYDLVLTALPFAYLAIALARRGFPRWWTNAAVLSFILVTCPQTAWQAVALRASGVTLQPGGNAAIGFGAQLLTLLPAVGVVALAALCSAVGRDSLPPDPPAGGNFL